MDTVKPLVSIIIPAYNAERYIVEAIESVIQQSYLDWELIVINDGSTDNTRLLVEAFSDERITVKSQENAGVSAARNMGISLSIGEYITFLDADDVLPQKSLETRILYLNNNEKIDMVHGGISIRNASLKNELKQYFPFSYSKLFNKILHLDSKLFFNPCYMVRKKCIDTIRFKEGMTHCEDILFLVELTSHNYKYASVNDIVYLYRVSDTSVMNNMTDLIEGYYKLLHYIKEIPSVSYKDTIFMRLKIMRVMLSWYIRNGKIFQAFVSCKVLYK